MRFSKYKYDVFISHAVEDKLTIANDLFKRLEEEGLSIWYSGKDLRIGDSIEAVIRENLSLSRYAVVIFSKAYLSKNWTMKELYLLLGHEISKRKVILPILLDVTVADLTQKDIAIADRFAIPVDKGLDYIVEKILEEVKGIKRTKQKSRAKQTNTSGVRRRALLASFLVIGLFALSYFVYALSGFRTGPDGKLIQQVLQSRIDKQLTSAEHSLRKNINLHQSVPVLAEDIIRAFAEFDKVKSYYRNEYEFSNGVKESRFRKNIEKDLAINIDNLSPHNLYGFKSCKLFLSPRYRDGLLDCISYTLINSDSLAYTIVHSKSRENGDYEVTVRYDNNIRGINVTLIFPTQDFPKRNQVSLQGFLPIETFVFHQQEGAWSWIGVE